MATVPASFTSGLGQKKTLFIMVAVVGCVAILWPKVFHPMMTGSVQNNKNMKDHRGAGCCGVVLDTEVYANTTLPSGNFSVRKSVNLVTLEIISIRQERPPHLHPDAIHPAMKERGRTIPPTQTVPILERPHAPPMPPRIVEGRPGPIPGMRPPMGGGSHQAPAKTSSMGLIMPLYTVGIVSFFVYTIMKLICKKTPATTPYAEVKPDETFRKEVFGDDHHYIKRPDDGSTKLGQHHQCLFENGGGGSVTHENGFARHTTPELATTIAASPVLNCCKQNILKNIERQPSADADEKELLENEIKHLLEIESLRKKLEETEQAMTRIISQMGNVPHKAQKQATEKNQNGHIHTTSKDQVKSADPAKEEIIENKTEGEKKTVHIVGMEMTASCVGGKKWSRPGTPDLAATHSIHPKEEPQPEPQEIYLEGALPHESQILVAESETKTETATIDDDEDYDLDGVDPPVVLNCKMTLSLINLDHIEKDAVKDHVPEKELYVVSNGTEEDETAKDNAETGVEKPTIKNGHADTQTKMKTDNKELLENEE